MKKIVLGSAALVAAFCAAAADAPYPHFAEGFGVRRNVYANGRMTAACSDINGIYKLSWYGPELFNGRHGFMQTTENSTFANIFRLDVVIDGKSYRLPYADTTHYPFGYASHATLDGVKIRHELVLDGNVIFRRAKVLENPQGKQVKGRIVQSGYVWDSPPNRNRRPRFVFDGERTMTATVEDVIPAQPANQRTKTPAKPKQVCRTRVSIGSPALLEEPFVRPANQVQRWYLQTREAQDEIVFWMAFNPAEGEQLDSARVDGVFARFRDEVKESVRFETGDATLDSALNCVGPFVSMMEVEKSGGFRASPFYWVWGWDSMVHMETMALCGWKDATRRMLEFYRAKSVPGKGIAHCFGPQYQVEIPLSPVVQLFYVTLLNGYYQTTGDRATLEEMLPFAREIVARAKEIVRPGEILERGFGFYPDFPNYINQEKDNWSLMNNGIYYQGLCAWRELTGEGGEDIAKLEKALVDTFWSKSENYWCDAVIPATGKQLEAYPSYGILHITPFAEDPVRDRLGRIAEYQLKHHRVPHGVNMFEIGSKAYMADGNQYGAYYPVTDRGHWNIMNAVGDLGSIAALDKIVAEHWKTLTYPEGQTLEFANTDLLCHGDEPGNKQAFAAKAWLADAIEVRTGLKIRKDGLHFHAMGDGRLYAIRNLEVRGAKLDVESTGRGARAEYELNGTKLAKPFIGWDALKSGRNVLKIKCGE